MKILVIGCGSIGQRHARNLKAMADVIVCERDVTKGQDFAQELGCAYFSDLDQALSEKPDGVIIALPTQMHYAAALHVLINSKAFVLLEKPICIDLADARDLEKNGKGRLFVVTNMRFHQAILALKEGLQEIGKPLFARAQFGNYLPSMRPNVDYRQLYVTRRETGGGAVMDCIHEIDYLMHLFGPVKSVVAELDKVSAIEIEAEDYASLHLNHASGMHSEIHLDYVQKIKQRGCEIIGDAGTVIWRSIGKAPEHCKVEVFNASKGQWRTLIDTVSLDMNACYVSLVEEFINVIKGQASDILADAGQAIAALACVHGAYRSSDEGVRVEVSKG
jgi:predicted dehydrogenase